VRYSRFLVIAMLVAMVLVVSACIQPLPMPTDSEGGMNDAGAAMEGEETILFVGPTQADCVGVGPQLCLLVKESPAAEYTYFYGSIDGFSFVPGYEYELLVQVTPVENAPADASSLKYTLVEVTRQTEVGPMLENTDWQLAEMTRPDGGPVPELSGNPITANFVDEIVAGSGGCNTYSASYTVDANLLSVEAMRSTGMACVEPVMSQEQLYLDNLTDVTRYAIVGEELRLYGDMPRPLLTFGARISTGLTDVTWVAISVNNGQGGVTSIVDDSEITAVFAEEGSLMGNAGCNNYGADYEIEGEAMSIGPARSTRKACAGPEGVMEQEQAYLQALAKVANYSIAGDRLQLRDADGALQADFRIRQDDN
jgi:heat shock protein HslJ